MKRKFGALIGGLLLLLLGAGRVSADCTGPRGDLMFAPPPRNGQQTVLVIPYGCSWLNGGHWITVTMRNRPQHYHMGDNVQITYTNGRMTGIY